nr:phage tail tape measure protein [Sphingobium lignivorans]
MIAGAAILAPLVLAGKGAADFQTGMTDIALKAELSRDATAGMQANILAAARAAGQLPENMRAGVDVLAGFGMSPQEATRMIAPIGRVATAYRAEIDDLAAASYANFLSLSVPINDTAKALEIMAAAGNAGAFEIRDMAQYFPGLTAQAKAFGQSGLSAVADIAAAAQIVRRGTGDSASAATNLQNLLAKINTKETIDKFDKFGVDLPAALKKAYKEGKTPLEAIAEISQKALGGDMDRISFLFGDMQAQAALRALMQNMDDYRQIRSEAMASKGAVDAAFSRRSEDAAVQARALVGNLQRLAIVAGPVLLPPFVRLSEAALAITDRFANWAQANPRLVSGLLMLVGGFGLLRIGLGAAQLAIGALMGPIASLWRLWGAFRVAREAGKFAAMAGAARSAGAGILTAGQWALVAGRNFVVAAGQWTLLAGRFVLGQISGAASALVTLGRAALAMGAGFARAGLLMLANPIVLIVTAIVAAIGLAAFLIYRNWDRISQAFSTGIARVKSWFGGLPDWLRNIGSMMMAGLLAALNPVLLANRLVDIARRGITAFKNYFGIKSPSRLMMGMGGHIAGGLALGIVQGSPAAAQATQDMANRVAAVRFAPPEPPPPERVGGASIGRPAAVDPILPSSLANRSQQAAVDQLLPSSLTPRADAPAVLRRQAQDGPQPAPVLERIEREFILPPLEPFGTPAPRPGGAGEAITIRFGDIHITIMPQPGQSAAEIAAEVRRQLEAMASDAAASRRSSFEDEDA